MNGILLVNKEKDMTSRDVVNQVSKILHTKKIGHTGTLDPIATGVMVLMIGHATKLVEIVTAVEKEYVAGIVLGIKTDTGDITGTVLQEENVILSEEEIIVGIQNMVQTYNQTVPIYSAVKINGKKLYEYAREGKEIDLPSREITIYESECISDIQFKDGKIYFEIRTLVSKGTYIRSLIEDLAKSLGTIGAMTSLIRIKQGDYILNECLTLKDIAEGNYKIHDCKSILERYPIVVVDEELEQKIHNGCILENRYQDPIVLFENKDKLPLALYQVYEKDFNKIKPWKML